MANKFLITSIALMLIAAIADGLLIFHAIKWTTSPLTIAMLASFLAFLCFLVGVVYLVISNQRTSDNETIFSALHHFVVKSFILYVGNKKLRRFRACCKNPREAQENLLKEIVQKNKNTEYGQQFQLSNINSMEDLRANHPVTDYSHYEAFVNKIARGEKNVLTTEKITRLVLTSGTTGKAKRIPQDENSLLRAKRLGEALQHEMFPDLQPMQTKLLMHCNSPVRKTECGISITPLSGLEPHMVKHMVIYSTPPNGFLIEDFQEAAYVHLLFALREKSGFYSR